MNEQESIEAELIQCFHDFYRAYAQRGEGVVEALRARISPELTGFGTGRDERMTDRSAMLRILQEELRQQPAPFSLDFKWTEARLLAPSIGVVDSEAMATVPTDDGTSVRFDLRITGVFRKEDGAWRLIYNHGSMPASEQAEGDRLPIDGLKARNQELERLVAERTAEIEAARREAQIEAALERIRSRTMAMRSSDELTEVSRLLNQEVVGLGTKTWGCAFNIYGEDESTEWFGTEASPMPTYPTPREHFFLRFYEKGQQGETFHVEVFEGAACKAHYDYLRTLPVLGDMLANLEAAGHTLPTSQIDHVAYFKYGYLLFITLEPAPEAHDVFRRFARVFEQTYTRFLDLKKAEAQAHEAQIEAALERVRSRTMAMHKPDELQAVVSLVAEELQRLDVIMDAGGVIICTYFPDSKNVVHWLAAPDFSSSKPYLLPYFDDPIFNAAWASRENGDDFFSQAFSVEEKNSFFRHAFAHSDYQYFPEDFKAWILSTEHHALTFAWTKNAALLIPSFTDIFPSESDKVILKRFARVFEQAYTRYLDLQQADAQAREAQIEAALERVRSRTMAMQSSEELPEAANLLFEQVRSMGMPAWSAGYCIWGEDRQGITQWVSTEGKLLPPFWTPLSEDPTFIHMREAHERGESFYVEAMEGDALADHYRYMRTLPVVGDLITSLTDDGFPLPTYQINHCAYFSHGFLLFITYEPAPEAHDLFKRFATVFEQTYTRFLDLKQAEANAREAQIEAAMERVRSRALAMNTSEELLDVIFKIRQEYTGLGFPCGAFWHTRYTPESYHKALTGIDGQKLAALMALPRDFASNPALAAWERGDEKIGVFQFDTEAACQYLHHMVSKGKFDEVDPEAITEEMIRANDGWTFVQARTSHGEIGYSLWGETAPSQEAKDVLVRFTSAFDLAYRRFEDLQQSEADHRALLEEKALTEQALAELRATQAQLIQAEKLASLGQLTAGIAHEIKNPLNFINNFAELNEELAEELEEALRDGDDIAEILADLKQNASIIASHGKRADGIVQSMMAHASGGEGKRETTDVNAFVEEYLGLAYHGQRARVPGFNAELVRDFADDAGTVEAVPQEIGRVLLNLLGNAFDAVHEYEASPNDQYAPTVTVSTRRAGASIEIRIEDNGPGIPADVRDRIFEPFFTTKPTGAGTGLGLSLSHDIVTQGHGGTLTVETTPGQGAVFIVSLPA